MISLFIRQVDFISEEYSSDGTGVHYGQFWTRDMLGTAAVADITS